MTGPEFAAWRARHGWTQADAAGALGIGRETLIKYEREGPSRAVMLACAALELGITSYAGRPFLPLVQVEEPVRKR